MANEIRRMTEYEQAEKLFGEKLDSTIFTWDLYCGSQGISVLRIFDTPAEFGDDALDKIFSSEFICEGWCDASSLIVRPKSNGVAVMLWYKEEQCQVWCHVSKVFLETLYRRKQLSEK